MIKPRVFSHDTNCNGEARVFVVISDDAQVMVLAATNRPWELDEAILRRLPRAFEVGLPDQQQRASILRVILKEEDVEDTLDFEHLADLCEGYSGSDLTELCKQAAYLPLRDFLKEERLLPQRYSATNVRIFSIVLFCYISTTRYLCFFLSFVWPAKCCQVTCKLCQSNPPGSVCCSRLQGN